MHNFIIKKSESVWFDEFALVQPYYHKQGEFITITMPNKKKVRTKVLRSANGHYDVMVNGRKYLVDSNLKVVS